MEKVCLVHLTLALVVHFSSPCASAQVKITNQANSDASSSPDASERRMLFFSPPPKPLLENQSSLVGQQESAGGAELALDPALEAWPTPTSAGEITDDVPPPAPPEREQNFQWGPALRQSMLFLAVQHGYAFTQPKTRRALKGPFWKDYVHSVKNLRGWEDGGRFFTNHIAHPMQGSLTGFIQVQNDPRGRRLRFGRSKEYWQSRMKAMAWSAVFSTQFEIGPISQASIGNVGHSNKQTYVDLVVTPTVGTAWLITEDALDRFAISWLEKRTHNNMFVRITTRTALNPTRTFANLLRFKKPWHRDGR